ncbi:MAG: hypothetical protein AAGK30_03135, partial [Pseudomonadota bacterium]
MPTLYVTAEEYAALGEAEVQAIEASGEQVVIVDSEAEAERAGWQEVEGKQARVRDTGVSVSLTSDMSNVAAAPRDAVTSQTALLEQLVALHSETP